MGDPRTISYVPLDQMQPALRNAKRHNIEAMKHSIRTLGFIDAGVIDERTHRFVGGHGRWEAVVEMYAASEPVPDGIITDDDGQWCIPVQRGWASVDDAAAEAAVLLLNRLPELGGYDHGTLADMLENVNAHMPDVFEVLDYTAEDMDALVAAASAGALGEPEAPKREYEEDQAEESDPDGSADDVDDGLEDLAGTGDDTGEKVTCPHCGGHFTPGDKAIY